MHSIRKLICRIYFLLLRLFSLLTIFLAEQWSYIFFHKNRPGNFVCGTRGLFLHCFFWQDLGFLSLAFLKWPHLRCFFSFIIMQINYALINIQYLFVLFCWWHADFHVAGDFQSTLKAQRNKLVFLYVKTALTRAPLFSTNLRALEPGTFHR